MALSPLCRNFNQMKKLLLFLLPVFLLLATSCHLEKRLYRSGWYIEKNTQQAFTAQTGDTLKPVVTNEIQQKEVLASHDTVIPAAENQNPQAIPLTKKVTQKINDLRKVQKQLRGDPQRMTYAQARASMAKQGCTPNSAAKTVYILSIVSVISILFGVGLILMVVTLIISVFAIDRVIEDGTCVTENIAIIEAGRRIIFGTLIAMFILGLIALLLLFALLLAWL